MNEFDREGRHNFNGIILVIGIILLASTLRAPITSVGTLIGSIKDSLHFSNTVAGALTTLPLLAFAFVSPFAAKLSRRFGMERTIFISLLLIIVGIGLRSINGIETLFLGTLLIGLSIAIGNVLLPALIKKNFMLRIGLMTGVYAVSMNLSSAIASGVTVPLASISSLGWRGALAVFGVLPLLAILFWLPQIRKKQSTTEFIEDEKRPRTQLMRSSLAWKITLFMGLQSLIYYSIIAWLPEILSEQGFTQSGAGFMISLMQFAVLPFTFIVPIIAGRMKNQRLLVACTGFLFILGIGGISLGGSLVITLSMIAIGIACGSAFSLAMIFFSLRTKNSEEAAELSGMAQTFGYLLAAIGPLLFGFLRDATGSWSSSIILLIGVSVLIIIFGMGAGKKQTV
ncbi:CynX/NimT family MFS transporter [Sporosarcina sp. CAU 1771]